jgi:hypothetical protein
LAPRCIQRAHREQICHPSAARRRGASARIERNVSRPHPEQIITDLLGVALQEVAAAMPYVPGTKVIATDDQGDPIYEDAGPTPRFMELTRRNQKKLKTELKKG